MKSVARAVLNVEWVLLGAMIAVVWASDFNRVWVLLLWLVLLAARWAVERRLWRRTPLDLWFGLLFALGLISVAAAPFRYAPLMLGGTLFSLPTAYTIIALGRPLLGLILVTSFSSMADRAGRMNGLLVASAGLALLIGLMGMLFAQYITKSALMQPIVDLLPKLRGFPGAEGGFNVNEIAGAMVWYAPLMAGLALYMWRERHTETGRAARALRILAPIASGVLCAALFFGQSRFAIIGVVAAFAGLVWFLLRGRWRVIGIVLVALFAALQFVIYVWPNSSGPNAPDMTQRNEVSVSGRIDAWNSALAIVRDHPLTGAGVNMFRAQPVRDRYPALTWNRVLPHAHNEYVQVAADLGLPGLIVFIGFQVTAGWMLWRVWRRGTARDRAVALSIAAGLLAHIVYGMGDAIALWDRFAFGYWWLMALAAAQYAVTFPAPTRQTATTVTPDLLAHKAEG